MSLTSAHGKAGSRLARRDLVQRARCMQSIALAAQPAAAAAAVLVPCRGVPSCRESVGSGASHPQHTYLFPHGIGPLTCSTRGPLFGLPRARLPLQPRPRTSTDSTIFPAVDRLPLHPDQFPLFSPCTYPRLTPCGTMPDDTTPLIDVSSMHHVDDTVAVATAEDLVRHRALYDTRPGGWGRDLWFYWCNEVCLLGGGVRGVVAGSR